MCIALRAVPGKLFLPFHHVCLAPVFRDEPADAVAAFTGALGAFDAQQVEFSFDITEDDIGPPHYEAPRGLSLLCAHEYRRSLRISAIVTFAA
jgi:hypothetical protein